MSRMDILSYLSRNDKWCLGGGHNLIWAPTHPLWLEQLGFWDGAHLSSFELQPVFAITMLDGRARPIVPKFRKREWNPASLTQEYEASGRIAITEKRALLPNDTLVAELTLKNNGTVPQILHLFVWTAQRTFASAEQGTLSRIACDGQTIEFKRTVTHGPGACHDVACILGINRAVTSYSLNASQSVPNFPRWDYTPFPEKFDGEKLPNEVKIGDLAADGLVYMALHTVVKLGPHSRKTVFGAASISGDFQSARANLAETLKARSPIALSIKSWRSYFERVPHFACSDQYIQKYYWYRWYDLRLLSRTCGEKNIPCPTGGTGPTPVHRPALCGPPALMKETRWMGTALMAQASFLRFLLRQREDGSYPVCLSPGHLPADEPCHADWGEGVLQLCAVYPDATFMEKAYRSLVFYAGYVDREYDREGSGLYDAAGHHTGVDGGSQVGKQGLGCGLKAVETTTYVYRLKQALSIMAERLGLSEEAALWAEGAKRIRQAMLTTMWDNEAEMFFDVDPDTRQPGGEKTLTCFYPYATDLVGTQHLAGLKRHLLDPAQFWTPFPVATLSRDDSRFDPHGEWNGVRQHCPANGRVWPVTNCHAVEALANAADIGDRSLRRSAVDLLSASIYMMFRKGDVRYPDGYEHYHPLTGQPCLYRGANDYQCSWVVDLIMKYMVGLRPSLGGQIVVDPFPFETERIHVDRIPYQGHSLRVDMDEQSISLYVDGRRAASAKRGDKIEVQLEARPKPIS